MKCAILGTGKIGIDLYLKLKRKKKNDISIFNLNPKSAGAKYCKIRKFNYFPGGIKTLLKKGKFKIVFDTTNAKSNIYHYKKLVKKKVVLVNLTPSGVGDFYIPYIDENKNFRSNSFNLITCGGQSSIPIIYEISKKLKSIKYVEIVSAISSASAGMATRANIDEYLNITSRAVIRYTRIKDVKVILNINPGTPPVNMSNSIYIEFKRKITSAEVTNISKIISLINKKMRRYAKGYNADFLGRINDKCVKITLSVVGNGDYLPKYSGNLDIITNMANYIADSVR
tara:strand:- start:4861 stop:5712 length:852 start_codon:yes stop_codon:yes gene_type:complete